jgi:hypothetical protein
VARQVVPLDQRRNAIHVEAGEMTTLSERDQRERLRGGILGT